MKCLMSLLSHILNLLIEHIFFNYIITFISDIDIEIENCFTPYISKYIDFIITLEDNFSFFPSK